MIKSKKVSYIIIISIIIVGIILDLVTKMYFQKYFSESASEIVVIPNFFIFTYVKNTGAAYGMFSNSTLLLTIISIAMIIAFVVYDVFNHSNNILYVIGFSCVISGAIGNLVDRIFLGYVRDFISIRLFNFVFNIADVFVTIGMILFVIYFIISIIKEEKGKKNAVDK